MMIRRVLALPLNYDHPQTGQMGALRGIFGAGNVREYDYLRHEREGQSKAEINDMFVRAAGHHKPDWIWMQLQETNVITAEAIEEARRVSGAVVTHWMGDCRTKVAPHLAEICRVADLTLVSNTGQLDMYREAGAKRVRYVQIGLDPEDLFGDPEWRPLFDVPDVVFCGNYYPDVFPEGTKEREGAIRVLLDAGINVGVVGNGWPWDIPVLGTCTVKQQVNVYRKAKVALSISHFSDIARYYSDRQLIAMASGTAVLCRWVPDMEFTGGHDCDAYLGPSQLVGAVEGLLKDDKRRCEIGRAGRARVIREHTWHTRFLDLLSALEDPTDAP